MTHCVNNTVKYKFMATQTDSKVRARAVIPTMEHVMFSHGKQIYGRVLARLEPHQQELFRKRMDEKAWLSLSDFIDFNKAIIAELYNGDRKKAELLGAEAAERGLNTVLKFLIKVGDVRFSFRKATTIFASYYQPSRLVISANEPGYAEAVIYDLFDVENIIALRIKGFLRRLFELSGNAVKSMEMERAENKIVIRIHW